MFFGYFMEIRSYRLKKSSYEEEETGLDARHGLWND